MNPSKKIEEEFGIALAESVCDNGYDVISVLDPENNTNNWIYNVHCPI